MQFESHLGHLLGKKRVFRLIPRHRIRTADTVSSQLRVPSLG
jgi:hypothetical protein